MIIQKVRNKLFAEKFNGKTYGCGVIREDDPRTLTLGWSLFGYTPKNEVQVIDTLEVKDQRYNTCAQEAATSCVEVLKKEILSEQFQSTMLRAEGGVVQDGFSSLLGNLRSIVKRGICRKQLLNEDDYKMSYEEYTKRNKVTQEMLQDAELRKINGFAAVVGRDARLKAMDEGDVLYSAMPWYSGFNINGGFSAPWIIYKLLGWFAGDHAIFLRGHDLPRKVYIIQNSYGKGWAGYVDSLGRKWEGCFAIDMDLFDKITHGTYKLINIEENLPELIAKYEGKDVKGKESGIYRIEKGYKRPYPDKLTFYAFGGQFGANKTYLDIPSALLSCVPEGDEMNYTQSPFWPVLQQYWPAIKVATEPQNLKEVDKLITLFKFNGTMPITKRYPILGSSVDPEKLSLTLKGLIPLVMGLAGYYGVNLESTELDNYIASIVAIVGGVQVLYGAARKIYYKFKK